MIQKYVDRFMDRKDVLEARFREKHVDAYRIIVQYVLELIDDDDYDDPDPTKIHEIDDGDYQGTLLYIIPERGYQPSTYYAVAVGYGSCSGCDTLQRINSDIVDGSPNDDQVKDYMTLALHIVQGLRQITGYGA